MVFLKAIGKRLSGLTALYWLRIPSFNTQSSPQAPTFLVTFAEAPFFFDHNPPKIFLPFLISGIIPRQLISVMEVQPLGPTLKCCRLPLAQRPAEISHFSALSY